MTTLFVTISIALTNKVVKSNLNNVWNISGCRKKESIL